METKQNKRTHLIGSTFLVVGFAILTAYAFARRMPYLLNMHNMWLYFIFTLAIILVVFIYQAFFHQFKDPVLNSAMLSYGNKNKIISGLAILLISIIVVWMSWGLVGLSANLFSREPYYGLYIIDSLEPGGRKGWDVALVDAKNKNEYSLTLSRQYMSKSFPWKEGDLVCAKGRTSFFGAIIEDFNAGECKLA